MPLKITLSEIEVNGILGMGYSCQLILFKIISAREILN